jgi:hypothetical protein
VLSWRNYLAVVLFGLLMGFASCSMLCVACCCFVDGFIVEVEQYTIRFPAISESIKEIAIRKSKHLYLFSMYNY